MITSTKNGYGPICVMPTVVICTPGEPWLSVIVNDVASPKEVTFTSIKNWSPLAQSSITWYVATGLIHVAHATV